MSTSQLTAVAAGIAFAAVVLLVLIDPRKPRRRPAVSLRGRKQPPPSMEPAAVPAVLYRKPKWYQRIAAVTGMGLLALVVGFVVALAISVVVVGSYLLLRGAVG